MDRVSSLSSRVMALYFRYAEPIQVAWRKRSRLRLYAIQKPSELTSCAVHAPHLTARCIGACPDVIAAQAATVGKFLTAAQARQRGAIFRATAAVIELERYPHPAAYLQAIKHHSGGNLGREINRARAKFTCRIINRNAHPDDVHAIDNSLLFRSGGPVLSAVLARMFASPPLVRNPDNRVLPPQCPRHYRIDWGVFSSGADGALPGAEKLVGYLYLRRVENAARVMAFMGHGDVLRDGAMKLLFADVMHWLLARQDEAVQGLAFLQYGALEHGGIGLFSWKKRFGFVPVALDFIDASPCSLPEPS